MSSNHINKSSRNVYVIFGAAVWAGGQPSNALRRRTVAAFQSAHGIAHRLFLPSGAVGRFPPAEAIVMQSLLLENGVVPSDILLDLDSRDTLETVLNCTQIIKSLNGRSTVYVATDVYHLRRCLWLFRLAGIRARPCPIEDGSLNTPRSKWIYFRAKEYPAIVWDTLVLVAKGRFRIRRNR